jgi:hypothetical protein
VRVVSPSIFALAAISLSLTSYPVFAKGSVVDQRAVEAFQLFDSFCVQALGSKDRALSVLANGNAFANRLPDAMVTSLQDGKQGGVGWAIRSPSGAVLMLDYTATNVCGIRIAEASEPAVSSQFEKLSANAAQRFGSQIVRKAPTVTKEKKAKRTFYYASFVLGTSKYVMALSTHDKKIGETQHFITFGPGQ